MFNEDIVELIKYKGYSKSVIVADSAEEKSIKWMKKNGVPRIKSSVKGPDSIMFGIQYLTAMAIVVALCYVLSGYFSLYQAQKIVYSKTSVEFINQNAK